MPSATQRHLVPTHLLHESMHSPPLSPGDLAAGSNITIITLPSDTPHQSHYRLGSDSPAAPGFVIANP